MEASAPQLFRETRNDTGRRFSGFALAPSFYCGSMREPMLAVELEPGPLYVLRDRGAPGQFSTCTGRTRDSASSPSVVGLNLDIPHWTLAARDLRCGGFEGLPWNGSSTGTSLTTGIRTLATFLWGKHTPCSLPRTFLLARWRDHRPSRSRFKGRVTIELEACRNVAGQKRLLNSLCPGRQPSRGMCRCLR